MNFHVVGIYTRNCGPQRLGRISDHLETLSGFISSEWRCRVLIYFVMLHVYILGGVQCLHILWCTKNYYPEPQLVQQGSTWRNPRLVCLAVVPDILVRHACKGSSPANDRQTLSTPGNKKDRPDPTR